MSDEFDSCFRKFGTEHADLPGAERAALFDTSGFSVEGAFVDGYAKTSCAALAAVQKIYAKRGARAEDIERLTGILRSEQRYPNAAEPVLAAAGKAMLPALREGLGHPLPVVRARAVRTLTALRCGGETLGLANDPEPEVRRAVLGAGRDGKWLAAMGAQLEREPLAALRVEIVRRLARVRSSAAMRVVLRRWTDTDGDVRTAAAESLVELREAPKVNPRPLARLAYAWLMDEYEVGVCDKLLRYAPLLPYEPRALPALIALLEDAALGPLAAGCLARADETQAPVAASALAARAGAADEMLQVAVFEAMASLRDQRAVALFGERVAKWPIVRSKIGVLQEKLVELTRTGRAIPEPAAWPSGARPLVMDAGVRGVAPPSEADRTAYRQLTGGTGPERLQATKHQPRADRLGWWAGALLERMRVEESASIRETILGALGRLDVPEALQARVLALQDASARVRARAATDLAYRGGAEAARAILARLPVEKDDVVRRCLLDRETLLVFAPEGAGVIRALLDDPDPGVRERAEAILRRAE